MNISIAQIVSQIIAFLLMLWVLKKFAWKPFLKILEDRHNKIISEFKEIDKQKQELAKQTQDYNDKMQNIDKEAKAKMQEAIQAGKTIAQEIEQQSQSKAASTIAQAEKQASEELKKLEPQIKEQIIKIAAKMTEALIKEGVSPQTEHKLVKEFIDKAKL